MKKKIIGIIICMLLIATTVYPVTGIVKNTLEKQSSDESEKPHDSTVIDDEWPKFLHDLTNTGCSTSIAPNISRIKWIFHIEDGAGIESSPAIVNGKVYIGSDDDSSGGGFYCLDADTGEVLWKHLIPGGTSVCSPAVYDGKVYIGGVYDYTYCLDADAGDEIWKFYRGNGVSSSPAVVNGKVYIGRDRRNEVNGWLYCLDADTGGELWDYDMGFSYLSSPAVYDSKVYICSEDTNLYCFDADTGDKLWEYDTGDLKVHRSHPTVFDGRVYCGGSDVCCVDAETGEEIWRSDKGTRVSPAVAYGKVYLPDYNEGDGFHCLDAENGEPIWNYPEGGGSTCCSCPAVADGKVYAGVEQTGELICLDAETGEKLWDYKTNPVWWIENSPAVAYGRVYMGGGGTDNVYCFEDSRPPDPPIVNGPTEGLIDRDHDFSIVTIDPEGDDVKYYVDWGDGNTTGWIGPYPSGDEITLSHMWSEPNVYSVMVRAEDTYGVKSGWLEHTIEIIDGPLLEIQLINGGLFRVNTVVKNLGTADATGMNWSIVLDGGLILFGRETTGTGDIPIGGEIEITSKLIFGFGAVTVTVNATVPVGFSDTREQNGFVLLFFVMVKPSG